MIICLIIFVIILVILLLLQRKEIRRLNEEIVYAKIIVKLKDRMNGEKNNMSKKRLIAWKMIDGKKQTVKTVYNISKEDFKKELEFKKVSFDGIDTIIG